jgi:hypothetical protein
VEHQRNLDKNENVALYKLQPLEGVGKARSDGAGAQLCDGIAKFAGESKQ